MESCLNSIFHSGSKELLYELQNIDLKSVLGGQNITSR